MSLEAGDGSLRAAAGLLSVALLVALVCSEWRSGIQLCKMTA